MSDTAGLAAAIFAPATIALVGASADPTKVNSKAQRILRRGQFAGTIIPINPARAEIDGDKAYPSLRAVPQQVDHAFIMVPAAAVEEVIADCCAARVKVATIFSGGFADAGAEGMRLQQRLVARAREGGVRLIGPNCLGVVDLPGHMALTLNPVFEAEELKPGSLAVISQSGSVLGSLMSRAAARGLGFSRLISIGNECDVGVGELADMLVDDPNTKTILLFLETFRDAGHLARAARRAFAAGKPVIVYKLGRSAVGRQAAASHTGAMVGTDETANAFLRAHGMLRAHTLEGLLELPQLIAGYAPPAGRGVSILTGTGGGAAMVADQLGLMGDVIAAPPAAAWRRLGLEDGHAPMVDIPFGKETSGLFADLLADMVVADNCDAVVAVVGSSSRSNPGSLRDRIVKLGRPAKPVATFLVPEATEGLRLLQDAGFAGFRTPESCADAVHAYLNWRAPRDDVVGGAVQMAKVEEVLNAIARSQLHELEAYQLFSALGIETPSSRVIRQGGEDITPFDRKMALKILSRDIAHKTDAGLVRLNVSREALREEAEALLARAGRECPAATVEGVVVQEMQRGVAELILGYRRDAEVGPVIVLGIGGILAELSPRYCVRLAPVSVEEAAGMIDELPELRILDGYRGALPGDRRALAAAIHALSLLALLPDGNVVEAEINPLIVRSQGVVAVDGLVIRDEAP